MLLLIALQPARACEFPPVLPRLFAGGVDAGELPTDARLLLVGMSGEVEVTGPDGLPVSGSIERITTTSPGLAHWVPDQPLQPGPHHGSVWGAFTLSEIEEIDTVDFVVGNATAPLPPFSAEVGVSRWEEHATCDGLQPMRDVVLAVDLPEENDAWVVVQSFAGDDLFVQHIEGPTTLEFVEVAELGPSLPACFHVRLVGFGADSPEQVVCDAALDQQGCGCSGSPGPAALGVLAPLVLLLRRRR